MPNNYATLYVATPQINSTASTFNTSSEVGAWINGKQSFNFNIKMRQLLGDLYEKHDKFVIYPTRFVSVNDVAMSADQTLEYQIGGLSWINASYDTSSRSNSYWAHLCTFYNVASIKTVNTLTFDRESNALVFQKGAPDVVLDFRVINALTRAPATSTSTNYLPSVMICFKIVPYDD